MIAQDFLVWHKYSSGKCFGREVYCCIHDRVVVCWQKVFNVGLSVGWRAIPAGLMDNV